MDEEVAALFIWLLGSFGGGISQRRSGGHYDVIMRHGTTLYSKVANGKGLNSKFMFNFRFPNSF